jgi:hypothetical protein
MTASNQDAATLGSDSNDIKTPYLEEGRDSDLDTVGPAYVVDHHAERALCRKFDYRLLPVLALMYLFNALDKGNLGEFDRSLATKRSVFANDSVAQST